MSSAKHPLVDELEVGSNGLAFRIVHVFSDEVLADLGEGFRVIS